MFICIWWIVLVKQKQVKDEKVDKRKTKLIKHLKKRKKNSAV